MTKYYAKIESGDMIIICKRTRKIADMFIADCVEKLAFWKSKGVKFNK